MLPNGNFLSYIIAIYDCSMETTSKKTAIRLAVLSMGAIFIASFASSTHSGLANAQQNKTSMQPRGGGQNTQGMQSMTTASNAKMNIVLVHGAWADGSSWDKVIPILNNAGYHVIAVQLPEHSLADDVATVKRAIALVGGPTILVGHSYGGMVITNAAYNNPNVKGLVYIAAFAPDQGQSLGNFVDPSKLPKDLLIIDSGGFAYINPAMFPVAFAQDVNSTEANIMAIVQKPFSTSIFAEKSGPPAWKQLPTWYQVSENDHMIPPDAERMFAKQMNATTISLPSSHASLVSHPNEIAKLILDAANNQTRGEKFAQ
jgi:pimeloyl-ACP methyl ester carboxylesterase